jgi:hypothetical protein
MRTLFDVPTRSDRGGGRARGDVCRLCLAAREVVEFPPHTTGALLRDSFLAERLCHQLCSSGGAPKEVMHIARKNSGSSQSSDTRQRSLTCRPGPSPSRPRLEPLSGRPPLFGTEALFHHRRGTAISFVAGLLNCSAPLRDGLTLVAGLHGETAGPQVPLFQLQRQGRCPRGSASLVRVHLPCRQNNGAHPASVAMRRIVLCHR